ncbi:MAG: tripartite tricarboxylate transporter substrate binding protein [Hyphomicrobiales bacterium]|nr:tripartite tricarboxylate transporter substrate binding protein [Hyphomicrobiales bacterium]
MTKWLKLWWCIAASMVLAGAPAGAQPWPSKPVHIVVSSGAGGTADIMARLVGDKLAAALGQPVVIENRTGAGGHLGAKSVARAAPDGYTLLMSGSPTHSVGPHLFKNLGYDPMRDVPPVAMVAAAPNLLVVNASLPVRSLAELVNLAREKPGQLTYSSAGPGTSGHLAAELLKYAARVDMRHVPYKSGPEAVTGVLAGDVSFIFFTVPSVLKQVETGKLRALAITSATRSGLVPDVPTVAELGYPGFEVLAWYALFAPRDTPASIIARLGGEIDRIVRLPEVKDKMAQLGAEPKFLNAADLTAFVNVESPKWGQLIRESGTTLE